MAINPADVAQAYTSAANGIKSGGLSSPDEAKGGSFADVLKNTIDDVQSTGRESEKMAIQAMSGEAELVDVVTAISAAEVTLETVVAVRDKVISAYHEIMRMPI